MPMASATPAPRALMATFAGLAGARMIVWFALRDRSVVAARTPANDPGVIHLRAGKSERAAMASFTRLRGW